jgi:hypothetical protein
LIQIEDGSVLVNATEMAAAFDKKPGKWLELPSTKEFISALSSIRKSDTSLVATVMGSPINGGGTWLHEDVVIEFARWLSPEFAIWCNDRIKELLKEVITALPHMVEAMLVDPDLVFYWQHSSRKND